ncbi:uncharacterized protein LOC123216412 [Mangifera indica]|uniref:uncharacterized protein LOC123216412 n=1 Tax=Mangifera indica TaxID=29780 RepID=UPI001CF96D6D|nr:uncharacterized protein LOC123216412 [Mangifera indica]
MTKKSSDVSRRVWNLLRLALLWARKSGVFKRCLTMEVGVLRKFIKSLGPNTPRDQIYYGERELSFDKTPIFNAKMHHPASMRYLIPCMAPPVDFDYDFDIDDHYHDEGDGGYAYDYRRKSCLKNEEEYEEATTEEKIPLEEQGIDLRAEEFIAKFYQQIKMQRQISYLERLNKSTT